MTNSNLLAVPPVVVAGPARDLAPLPWPYAVSSVELTVVVPFQNPGARLQDAVQRLSDALHAQRISFEVIAVAAGSRNGSAGSLGDIAHTRVVTSAHIQDKGAAMHFGFAMARGAWICFADIEGEAEVDAYELVEHFHLAREKNA
ncbi:glycosyltransferase [Pseudosporangium ferrugineum]|uniref:Glycosyl transferase family 2 n=1 Tax=Pseudosporangium ferrugineum TaxID=439699 RepID=A0A2T0RDT2_9ACTN|nr:glycosyltransferase [Pseudosporangium ferrugineum]PRY19327.1 glycosyl transferase family 2 [Pseudosporangium ferrugineum]